MSEYLDRKQVIELYEKYQPSLATQVYEFGEKLKALPTVTIPVAELDTTKEDSDRPHGEWVRTTVGNTEFINCKNCGCGCPLYSYVKKGEKEEKVQHYETDFCPNCGADMREGEAE